MEGKYIVCNKKLLFRGIKIFLKTQPRKANGFIYNYWAFNLDGPLRLPNSYTIISTDTRLSLCLLLSPHIPREEKDCLWIRDEWTLRTSQATC